MNFSDASADSFTRPILITDTNNAISQAVCEGLCQAGATVIALHSPGQRHPESHELNAAGNYRRRFGRLDNKFSLAQILSVYEIDLVVHPLTEATLLESTRLDTLTAACRIARPASGLLVLDFTDSQLTLNRVSRNRAMPIHTFHPIQGSPVEFGVADAVACILDRMTPARQQLAA